MPQTTIDNDPIFRETRIGNITVKNPVFRSSISGRIDNYNGSGTQARVNWEERFAAGGVGAIISAHSPVDVRGRILPNYAHVDADDKVEFWRTVGERVHAHDCRFVLQLSHGGRQRDIGGVENAANRALSATDKPDPIHGFPCEQMSQADIDHVVAAFAAAARRAQDAELDGVEIHACNGYLFTQFLSSAINARTDRYGGPLGNRARLLLEVVRAVRHAVRPTFHVQVKISGVDHNDAFLPWTGRGNDIEDTVRVCQWVQDAGADAIHVSTGSFFPHPLNPAGDFPPAEIAKTYDTMVSSGIHTFRNYLLFRSKLAGPLVRWMWRRTQPPRLEGLNLADAAEIKRHVDVPVICAGGFQTASVVRQALRDGLCDGVSIARPLMANPDLVRIWASGEDVPDRPCTYCNLCLFHVIEDPLGCYDLSRFDGDRERMTAELMAFYRPDGFGGDREPAVRRVS
jgi:2,4-dienoyl-CoA reductase-like NADH-dependent reductase (Old Yellow Enzyme family)